MTAEAYRALPREGSPASAVVQAMDRILGGELTPLSREQKERLRELLAVRGQLAPIQNPR
jgi:hypothetical protein